MTSPLLVVEQTSLKGGFATAAQLALEALLPQLVLLLLQLQINSLQVLAKAHGIDIQMDSIGI